MFDNFCLWAPWVFSALAGLAGWLLRWWYDDKQFDALRQTIKTKDDDLYHLNEAHNLLLNDKEKKLADYQASSDIKDRSIAELQEAIDRAETTNKSLLSQVVASKEASAAKVSSVPLAAKVIPSATVSHDKTEIQKSEEVDKQKEKVTSSSPSNKKKKGRRKRCKKKLRKSRRIINDLRAQNDHLLSEVQKSREVKEVIKEIPVTIFKTIRIRERIDREKMSKLIKNLPLIKSKKTIRKKKKKGKPRIVSTR